MKEEKEGKLEGPHAGLIHPLRGRTTEGWVSRYTPEVRGRGHRHNGAPPDIRVAVPKGRRRNHGEVTDSEHTGH